MAWNDGEEVFEQRRVRHVTSILLRNVEIPANAAAATAIASTSTLTTPIRPRPRRSVSTASTSSATTVRRAPSVRSNTNTSTPYGKSRGRASSIASSHKGVSNTSNNHNPGTFEFGDHIDSDLAELRLLVEARLCHTFVTLSRRGDGSEIFRTKPSDGSGINFEWGNVPGSASDPSGLPLHLLEGDSGVAEGVIVAVWYKRGPLNNDGNGKGKARDMADDEKDDRPVILIGTERQQGWAILLQQDVLFKDLVKVGGGGDLSTAEIPNARNCLLFGLSKPLANVRPPAGASADESEESSGTLDAAKAIEAKDIKKKKATAAEKESQQFYYAIRKDGDGGSSDKQKTTKPKVSLDEAESKAKIRTMLKNGTMVRAYEIEDVLRLLQLQRELYQLQSEVCKSEAKTSSRFLTGEGSGYVAKFLQCAEQEERLVVLWQERERAREGIKAKRKILQERHEAINRRKARLEIVRRTMAKEKTLYDDLQAKLTQLKGQCDTIRGKVYARRVTLLRQLEFIYPVELVDGVKLLFSIVGVPLANRVVEEEYSSTTKQEEDDVVSSALGLVGQVVVLMSGYMDTPVHYSIVSAGSRSIIQDSISVMSGPRAFPLYSKGVEKYRFEYAIFLLNKDIEQLMNNFGITVLDIRNTLPNLKNLLVTLSASSQPESRLSRRNLIGNEMISLKADRKKEDHSEAVQAIASVHEGDSVEPAVAGIEKAKQYSQRAASASSSSWGMSLLGWGNAARHHQSQSSVAITPTTSSHLPTVRTLGGTTTK